jgi:hypothetical protein
MMLSPKRAYDTIYTEPKGVGQGTVTTSLGANVSEMSYSFPLLISP